MTKQLTASHLGLPPPAEWTLYDADRAVGWTTDHTVGLVRPGDQKPSDPHSFAFELQIPQPVDELRVRAMAHLMYRTLRTSGVRWTLWEPEAGDAVPRPRMRPTSPHGETS